MTKIFPDSGVPHKDAKNSIPDAQVASVNCDELWYSTSRCQPRFDPAAANAVLSELIRIINKGEVVYDCNFDDRLSLAVQYLIQRGIPSGTVAYYGPFDYVMYLDPPATRLSDMMTLLAIPQNDNQGAVRINLGGLGWAPLYRNDGKNLEAKDLLKAKPALIAYWGGAWYHLGLCASQVPIIAKGEIEIWIRTDGNDDTGDGTENTPAKAFRTILGAWVKVGTKYAATPLILLHFKLGIPGTYTGVWIGGFGGGVKLSGAGGGGREQYRIAGFDHGSNIWSAFTLGSIDIEFKNLTFMRDGPSNYNVDAFRIHDKGGAIFDNCDFETACGASSGSMIICAGGACTFRGGTINFKGNGSPCGNIFTILNSGVFGGTADWAGCRYNFNDIIMSGSGFYMIRLGISAWGENDTFTNNGSTGAKYSIHHNSILEMGGRDPPGTIPGNVSTGAQYIA
jgi:hypothetical protein